MVRSQIVRSGKHQGQFPNHRVFVAEHGYLDRFLDVAQEKYAGHSQRPFTPFCHLLLCAFRGLPALSKDQMTSLPAPFMIGYLQNPLEKALNWREFPMWHEMPRRRKSHGSAFRAEKTRVLHYLWISDQQWKWARRRRWQRLTALSFLPQRK